MNYTSVGNYFEGKLTFRKKLEIDITIQTFLDNINFSNGYSVSYYKLQFYSFLSEYCSGECRTYAIEKTKEFKKLYEVFASVILEISNSDLKEEEKNITNGLSKNAGAYKDIQIPISINFDSFCRPQKEIPCDDLGTNESTNDFEGGQ